MFHSSRLPIIPMTPCSIGFEPGMKIADVQAIFSLSVARLRSI